MKNKHTAEREWKGINYINQQNMEYVEYIEKLFIK